MEAINAYKTDDGKIFATEEEAFAHEKKVKGLQHFSVELSFSGYYYTTVWAKDEYEAQDIAETECYPEEIDFEQVDCSVNII